MGDAWDPTTGQAIGNDDLAALLACAQAVGDGDPNMMAAEQPTTEYTASQAGTLIVKLVDSANEAHMQFATQDKHVAASRVCSFLEHAAAHDARVIVECGAMAAIVCRAPNGTSYQASWMDRANAKTDPSVIQYTAEQISHWALHLAACFLGQADTLRKCELLNQMATERARLKALGQPVPPTPLTTVPLQHLATLHQGVVPATPSQAALDHVSVSMAQRQASMFA